jgi:hypothetical protein
VSPAPSTEDGNRSNFRNVVFFCFLNTGRWTKSKNPVVLNRLRVFGNRVLRRIYGPKRDEMTGGWKTLHNEELHSLYSSSNVIRIIKTSRMRCSEHVARMEKRAAYSILVGKPEGERPRGRPRCRWLNNI